jgi:hypothetical protein
MAYDLLTKRQTPANWSLGLDEPLVWTPSAVKSELLRVLGVVDTVNRDMSRAVKESKLSGPEWEQWRQTYLTSHEFLTHASNKWGSNVKIAREHETQALKWRELVASRGGQLQGPKNPGREPESKKPPEWITTANIALAVGGIAAAALLITAVRK